MIPHDSAPFFFSLLLPTPFFHDLAFEVPPTYIVFTYIHAVAHVRDNIEQSAWLLTKYLGMHKIPRSPP